MCRELVNVGGELQTAHESFARENAGGGIGERIVVGKRIAEVYSHRYGCDNDGTAFDSVGDALSESYRIIRVIVVGDGTLIYLVASHVFACFSGKHARDRIISHLRVAGETFVSGGKGHGISERGGIGATVSLVLSAIRCDGNGAAEYLERAAFSRHDEVCVRAEYGVSIVSSYSYRGSRHARSLRRTDHGNIEYYRLRADGYGLIAAFVRTDNGNNGAESVGYRKAEIGEGFAEIHIVRRRGHGDRSREDGE